MNPNFKHFFNRELSWLKYNQRVLLESIDKNNPLLERLRFIAITRVFLKSRMLKQFNI